MGAKMLKYPLIIAKKKKISGLGNFGKKIFTEGISKNAADLITVDRDNLASFDG